MSAMPPLSPRSVVIGLLVLVSVTLLAHFGSLQSEFIIDDYQVVVDNPLVTQGGHWGEVFSTDYFRNPNVALLYRPAVVASFKINRAMFGAGPAAFHVVNLALHLLNTLLVALVLWQLTRRERMALIAALLFAVHPLVTEAVGVVFARTELLAALGMLLALSCWLAGRETTRWPLWAFGAMAAMVLALLSKESAVCLPGLVVLEGLVHRRPWRDTAKWAAVLSVPIAAYLWLRWVLFGALVVNTPDTVLLDLVNPAAPLHWAHRMLVGLSLAPMILGKFVWPMPLSLDYSFDQLSIQPGLSLLLWAGLGLILIWLTVREVVLPPLRSEWADAARLGAGWTLCMWILVSNIPLAGSVIFAERLLYFPLIGLCLVAAWLIDMMFESPRRTRLGVLVVSGIVIVGVVCDHVRHAELHDMRSVSLATAEASPRSAKALAAAGGVLVAEAERARDLSQLEAALDFTHRATQIEPTFAMAWKNLGQIEMLRGNPGAARVALERAMIADTRLAPLIGPVWRGLVSRHWDSDNSPLRWRLMALTARSQPQRESAESRLRAMGVREESPDLW